MAHPGSKQSMHLCDASTLKHHLILSCRFPYFDSLITESILIRFILQGARLHQRVREVSRAIRRPCRQCSLWMEPSGWSLIHCSINAVSHTYTCMMSNPYMSVYHTYYIIQIHVLYHSYICMISHRYMYSMITIHVVYHAYTHIRSCVYIYYIERIHVLYHTYTCIM